MSWIKDVREQISKLDTSRKSLRNFGLVVGGVFAALAVLAHFKEWAEWLFWILAIAGGSLLLFGAIFPTALRAVYKVWMGFSFAMGWIVSRVLLTVLFYLVITPIGVLAKLLGKDFLQAKFEPEAGSYWIVKPKDTKRNYSNMY